VSGRQGSNAVDGRCTTTFKNAHETVFRELLYRWHPWFGLQVAIHEAVDKADGVVFRCTLNGSAADRWLEIPAWMFDRAACPHPLQLTASPFVGMDALSVLSDLLWQALKLPLSSSNAPHSGASRSFRDQNRGEAHDHAKSPASDVEGPGKAQQSDRSRQIELFDGVTSTQMPAWRDLPEETRATLTGLLARLILEHARIGTPAVRTEAGHDY